MTRIGGLTLALAGIFQAAWISADADAPPDPVTVADVRCVVIASVFASDPANASSAALLSFYFLGRIDSREPATFNLPAAMLAQINLMSQEDFKAEGKRCGKELEARALYMTEVGKTLTDQTKSGN